MTPAVTSASGYIESLELMGMQFGLDRMQALMEALDHPEQRFDAIHVVGSNGKSSTVRFCEALLEAEGVASGAYLSPHLTTFRERIRIGGETIDEDAYERAVLAVRDSGLELTQFEALTGAAYVAFAAAAVEVAVVEAGLGGRLDATNVLGRSTVQVLTNVSLEHAELLGPTRELIAREKLAVVPDGGRVVLGEPGWEELVPQAATDQGGDGGRLVPGSEPGGGAGGGGGGAGTSGRPGPDRDDGGARPARAAGPKPARDLGRRSQPGRHAAAGGRAAGAARRPPRGGGVLGARRQGRGRDGVAASHRLSDHHRHRLQQPALAAGGGDRVAGGRPDGRAAARGAGGGAGAGRPDRRGGRVRVAVPAARPAGISRMAPLRSDRPAP